METIGQRIRRRRKELGLTIEDVKGVAGISLGTMSSLENDKYAPSVAVLIPLSLVLKVSIDWIVTGNEFHVSEIAESEHLLEKVVSPEDIELLAKFHQLPEKQQGIIEGRIEEMLSDCKAGSSSKESSRSKSTGRQDAAGRAV